MDKFTQGSRAKQQTMVRAVNNPQILTSLTAQSAINPSNQKRTQRLTHLTSNRRLSNRFIPIQSINARQLDQ